VQLINLYRKNHVEYQWTQKDREEQKVLRNAWHNSFNTIVDSQGQKIADSNSQLSKTPESFANLQSFKDAISGKSGYNIEVVNVQRCL
jgi:uncharacterized protein YnzC (UPF0291/DUF896 family)